MAWAIRNVARPGVPDRVQRRENRHEAVAVSPLRDGGDYGARRRSYGAEGAYIVPHPAHKPRRRRDRRRTAQTSRGANSLRATLSFRPCAMNCVIILGPFVSNSRGENRQTSTSSIEIYYLFFIVVKHRHYSLSKRRSASRCRNDPFKKDNAF